MGKAVHREMKLAAKYVCKGRGVCRGLASARSSTNMEGSSLHQPSVSNPGNTKFISPFPYNGWYVRPTFDCMPSSDNPKKRGREGDRNLMMIYDDNDDDDDDDDENDDDDDDDDITLQNPLEPPVVW